jgi:hypothetical protein
VGKTTRLQETYPQSDDEISTHLRTYHRQEVPANGQAMETKEMELEKDPRGLDPNTSTGTHDRLDADTGVYATGGTPVTTGHGEGASTIGTGTPAGEAEHEAQQYSGSTPRSEGYSSGVHGDTDVSETTESAEAERALDPDFDSSDAG